MEISTTDVAYVHTLALSMHQPKQTQKYSFLNKGKTSIHKNPVTHKLNFNIYKALYTTTIIKYDKNSYSWQLEQSSL